MNLRILFKNVVGILFTNRVHVFVMPILATYFINQTLKLPLPIEYYLMICLTTAGGYIYNMQTDVAEDAVNYMGRYRFFGTNPTATKLAIVCLFFAGFLLSLRA